MYLKNKNNNKIQLFMNSIVCPSCQQKYSQNNPPRKLIKCQHNICQKCLSVTPKCPLDDIKIEFRRYTLRGFKINDQLLQQALNSSLEELSEPRHSESISENQFSRVTQTSKINHKNSKGSQKSPKASEHTEYCLLHSKQADLVCCTDCTLICSNCALFGQHKGHKVQNYQHFITQLTSLTEQSLGVFDLLKQKQENVSEQIVKEYIDECYKTQRDKQIKIIRKSFSSLVDKIRKIEKLAIVKLDDEINEKKDALFMSTNIKELEEKKKLWYQEVERLGNVMQEVYSFREIKNGLNYLDVQREESYIVRRGQYLNVEFSSAQNSIKQKVDQETGLLIAKFNDIDKILEEYCYFKKPIKKKGDEKSDDKSDSKSVINDFEKTVINKSHGDKDRDSEQDILLDPQELLEIQTPQHVNSLSNTSISPINQKYAIDSRMFKVNQVPITHSINNYFDDREEKQAQLSKSRHRSRCDSTHTTKANYNMNQSKKYHTGASNINVLAPSFQENTSKKRNCKKIEVPEKYRQALEDLKNDKCEVIDFNGAELGDQNILAMLEYIQKSKRLRNLKLVRNKLTDDCVQELISACFMSKVTSLNLGQNNLTERTLQIFEMYDLGDLRNITLSLNKINRRNVKTRLDDFAKRGITMSI